MDNVDPSGNLGDPCQLSDEFGLACRERLQIVGKELVDNSKSFGIGGVAARGASEIRIRARLQACRKRIDINAPATWEEFGCRSRAGILRRVPEKGKRREGRMWRREKRLHPLLRGDSRIPGGGDARVGQKAWLWVFCQPVFSGRLKKNGRAVIFDCEVGPGPARWRGGAGASAGRGVHGAYRAAWNSQ